MKEIEIFAGIKLSLSVSRSSIKQSNNISLHDEQLANGMPDCFLVCEKTPIILYNPLI